MDELIILRSVYGKVGMKYYINPARDPKTGRFPACVKRVDSNGDMVLSEKDKSSGQVFIPENHVFIIEDGKTFNLEDPYDRAEWEAIQFCPVIALSRDQRDSKGNLVIDGDSNRYGYAELYVERPEFIANKKISKRKLIHKAEEFIFEDPKGNTGRAFIAKLLGRNVRSMADADIQDYLLDVAQKDPNKIINLYCADDISYRLLFSDAKEKGIIYTKNKIYLYGENQVVLGATDDAVVSWLSNPKNSKVVELIRRDVYPEMYADEVVNSPKLEQKKTK